MILRVTQIYLLALAALLPVVVPILPGNTAMVDYVNVLAIGPVALYLLFTKKLETKALPAVLVILFGSLLSTINSHALEKNLTTLAQEAYLYVVMLMLLNLLDSDREALFLMRCWFLTACVIAVMALSEVAVDPTVRARATFDNPNMTASYLGTSMFLILVPRVLVWRPLALAGGLLIFSGVLATKSMSALVAVTASSALLYFVFYLWADARRRFRMAVAGGVILLAGSMVMPSLLAAKNYANRMEYSAEGRELIWHAGVETFLDNPMGIGIGPAGFSSYLVLTGGPFKGTARKELHSDYLSFLVERGVVGFAGLVLFLVGFVAMLWRCVRGSKGSAALCITLALVGMFAFNMVDSLSHEMMHYRHVWVLLGLIAARDRMMRVSLARPVRWVPRPARVSA
ncbi:MAG: O-antigen ligase family protein [Candidatus Polarisedimenticolia bacterium]